jgi:DNA-binding response OmpR family regulator
LAVLNWMMPGMDGHRICRRLYEQKSTVVPVLMIGRSFLNEAWSTLDLRAQYVVSKPFSQAEINEQICGLIRAALPLRAGRGGWSALSACRREASIPMGTPTETCED